MTTSDNVAVHVKRRPKLAQQNASHSFATLALLLVAPLTALGVSSGIALNGDVRYTLGALETGSQGGAGGPATIFVARPLAYRLLLWLLDGSRKVLGLEAGSQAAETVIRLTTLALVVGVTALLWAGVRRHLGPRPAGTVAIATGVALGISTPFNFLEPDWVGVLIAVAAIGAALAPSRDWLGVVLGGAAVWLCVAMKLATAPWAVLAIGVVAAFTWSRGWRILGAGSGLIVVWLLATWKFQPLEWMWLRDMVALVPTSPLKVGIRWWDSFTLAKALRNIAVQSPIVLLLPAALVALVGSRPAGRRLPAAALAAAALPLSVAAPYGQGEWLAYHFAGLPVLAAGLTAAAICTPALRRAAIPFLLIAAVAGIASMVVLGLPPGTRARHVELVGFGCFVIMAATVGLVVAGLIRTDHGSQPAILPERAPVAPRGTTLVVGSIALSLGLMVPVLPSSHWALTGGYAAGKNSGRADSDQRFRLEVARLHRQIGAQTPVLYLTFGQQAYFLGNPTSCRYPSPQWLQRSTRFPHVREFASYADNLRCVMEDRSAQWLVVDPRWIDLQGLDKPVRDRLNTNFDCARALGKKTSLHLCPRRASTGTG